MKQLFKNILFSLIIISFFFAALEIFQRVRYTIITGEKFYMTYGFNKDIQKNDIDFYEEVPFIKHNGYYTCKPGVYKRNFRGNIFPIYINELGFRGEDIKKDKDKGIFRVIILGGSSVQGLESPEEATISSVLEKLLNENKPGFLNPIGKKTAEVINGGMCSHKMGNILKLLRGEILHLSPDVIIVYSAFNNYRNFLLSGKDAEEPNILFRIWAAKLLNWLKKYSLVLESLYEKANLFTKKQIKKEVIEIILSRYKEDIGEIIKTADENNIKPILIKQPLFIKGYPKLENESKMKEIEKKIYSGDKIGLEEAYYLVQSLELNIIDSIASKHGVMVIDPLSEMYEQDNPDFFYDIVHLTKKGNAILAQIIFENLKRAEGSVN